MTFTAACLQMRSTREPARNIDQLAALAKEAIAAGATFLQSPEMSNIVATKRAEIFEKTVPQAADPMLAAARQIARQAKVTVHLGSIIVKEGEKVANRAILIGPEGEIVATYDKLHLFDVDLPNGESWRESATYTAGRCGIVAPIDLSPAAAGHPPSAAGAPAMLGLTICYDLRFPYLFRALAEAGAEILSAPACFTRQTGEAHWNVLQRARAIETGSFMISAAQAGTHEDGRETYGHSLIVDPWGRVLAEAADQPGVVMASIDLAKVAEARGRIPVLRHTRAITVETIGSPKREAAE